ncbi:hypothetical protein O6H91_13G080000 [Diphasiastrum complanatum]|uniref:Uncharacterized protein n=2 Tax=Diphasiastrum complanatum TaxID=34168 RepID=A0ACC2BX06_DIPCM|nr:hypothetical protein O6H91_13G079500 [Diphasiastrum complanatum]KAJ7534106.1 hypothetical protein O6H91_13G080000 [Diphasiastrum complanatum]
MVAQEVVIAMGGNVGNRVANFKNALNLMRQAGINISRHACLYESAPAHVTEQPSFLNSAVAATTTLEPHALLQALKRIESHLGRSFQGMRYGPRPIDLDIIFYGNHTVETDTLQIPHKLFMERPFVLAPLIDLLDSKLDRHDHWSTHACAKGGVFRVWNEMGGERLVGREGLKRVFPIGERLWHFSARTTVMGILNLTPDSFSDGGRFSSVDRAVDRVCAMISEGADFIDIGAQSTRPNARRLSTEEEQSRLIPVLDALANVSEMDGIRLSVDTFDSKVAREAVGHGANIINDVSGGCLDPTMYETIAELGVPCVLMHMRGDPTTMMNEANTKYFNMPQDVTGELCARLEKAESAGIPSWHIITDPGIGFAKELDQNLSLLRDMPLFRQHLIQRSMAFSHGPILIGLSRKSFLGKICANPKAEDLDAASIAALTVAIGGGANVARVHNVKATRDACRVADAVYKHLQEPSETT